MGELTFEKPIHGGKGEDIEEEAEGGWVTPRRSKVATRKIIFVEGMTSDGKLKVSREGSKCRIYGT